MVITAQPIGANHAAYYIGTAQRQAGAVGYYAGRSGELSGKWISAGDMNVIAGAPIDSGELTAMLAGCDPQTGERLGKKYNAGGTFVDRLGVTRKRHSRGAFDVTYSVPKSVSAAWALADPEVRKQIEAAFDLSADAAVAYLQRHAVASRSGENGVNRAHVPNGATVARYDHWCSRAGDPQMHAHMLFANRVLCEDGKWRTLDSRLLHKYLAPASVHAAAVLRAEISLRLGWEWDAVGENLHAEIAGTSPQLTDLWSKRSKAIAREANRSITAFEENMGREPTADERLAIWDEATIRTRPPKPEEHEDPHLKWRNEAADLGIDPAGQIHHYQTAQRREPDRYGRPEVLLADHPPPEMEDRIEHILSLVEQTGNGLEDYDIDKQIFACVNADRSLLGSDRTGVELVVEHADLIRTEIKQRLIQHEGRWYSPGIAAAEHASISFLTSHHRPVSIISELDTEGLGEDQTKAAAGILANDRRAVVIVGPAGTGKTTMLAKVVAAVGSDNVLAVAPTATAAATLGVAIGAASNTLAYILEHQTGLPEDGLIIIDEATQASTRDLAHLAGLASATQSRLVMVGDPAQQTSINLGGMYETLADHPTIHTHILRELWRFTDRKEAAATNLIRRGDPNGLQYHHSKQRVHDGAHTEAIDHAAAWWADNAEPTGTNIVITAPTRGLTDEINREIGHQRWETGQTGDTVLTRGETILRVGDIAATRRNNRHLTDTARGWVKNGDRWIITGTTPDGSITAVRADDPLASATLPPDYFQHIDLGYAITQTRAQSITTGQSLTLITSQTSRKQLYVGLTRGRDANHLYVITDQPQHDPDVPPDRKPPEEIIDNALKRGGKWELSIPAVPPPLPEAAQHLARIAATERTKPLPSLPDHPTIQLIAQTQTNDWANIEEEIYADIEEWIHYDEADYDPEAATEQRRQEEDFVEWLINNPDQTGPRRSPNQTGPPDEHYDQTYEYDHDFSQPYEDHEPAYQETRHPADQTPDSIPADWIKTAAEERLADDVAIGKDLLRLFAGYDPYRKGCDLIKYHYEDIDNEDSAPLTITSPEEHRRIFGPILELTRLYGAAEHAGDSAVAAKVASCLAAVSPPSDNQLAEHEPIEPVSQWGGTVRYELIRNRADLLRQPLTALTHLLHETLINVAEDHPGLETPDQKMNFINYHRAVWEARLMRHLEHGNYLQPDSLALLWGDTVRSLAYTIMNTDSADSHVPCGFFDVENGYRHTPDADLLHIPQQLLNMLQPAQSVPLPDRDPEGVHPPETAGASQLMKAAADNYHRILLNNPKVQTYLNERGITEADWDKWNLGYAPNDFRYIVEKARNRRQDAIDAGIIRQNRKGVTYDTFRDRIMFPITDLTGTVLGYAGRDISGNPDTAKYMNTPATELYNKSEVLYGIEQAAEAINQTGYVNIVEGYTDVIAAHRAGFANTVGTGGVAYTDAHHKTLLQIGAHHLNVIFDGDEAGQTAAQRILQTAHQHGTPAATTTLPAGEDPASISPAELHNHIRNAIPAVCAQISHAHTQIRSLKYTQLDMIQQQNETLPGPLRSVLENLSYAYGLRPRNDAPVPETDGDLAAKYGTSSQHETDYIHHILTEYQDYSPDEPTRRTSAEPNTPDPELEQPLALL